jgi:phosphoserine phosphatase
MGISTMITTNNNNSSTHWKMGGFDLDGTLIHGSSVLVHVGNRLGRASEASSLVAEYENYRMNNEEVSDAAAQMFVGMSRSDLLHLMDDIPRLADIDSVVLELKKLNIRVFVATVSFDFAAEWFVQTYNFDTFYGIKLEFDKNGRATGRVARHATEDGKAKFVAHAAAEGGIALDDVFYVGDSRSDIPTFRLVGCAIALNASKEAKACAYASVDGKSLHEAVRLVPNLLQAIQ